MIIYIISEEQYNSCKTYLSDPNKAFGYENNGEYLLSVMDLAKYNYDVNGMIESLFSKKLSEFLSELEIYTETSHVQEVHLSQTLKSYAVKDNVTEDGKVLYVKVHGQKTNIAAGETHTFVFQNPYEEIYYFGAEIMQDIIGVSDFDVFMPMESHPDGGITLEKYGHSVNLGTIKYLRETPFAAKIPQGVMIRLIYTNDTNEEQEVGVNFLMNERRTPDE